MLDLFMDLGSAFVRAVVEERVGLGALWLQYVVLHAGNLCRHSAYFYKHLDAHDIIPSIIEKCSDEDNQTRKFACFAYGNAAFHNSDLYQKLAPGIPLLVKALFDPEVKTRVNAAGALGNLARNGDLLADHMISANAVKVSVLKSFCITVSDQVAERMQCELMDMEMSVFRMHGRFTGDD